MDYFYSVIWFAIGLILMFSLSKENKIFRFIGGYFIVLGGWWLANALTPEMDLFGGTIGIIFKVISGITLLVIGIFYYKNYWKKNHKKD